MDDVESFLMEQRQKLLRYLDGEAPASTDDPGPLDYVEQVLAAWSRQFAGRRLDAPTSRERSFWFALYLLEELTENRAQDPPDPYEAILLQNLAEVRELLRNGQELPERYFASRPGEC